MTEPIRLALAVRDDRESAKKVADRFMDVAAGRSMIAYVLDAAVVPADAHVVVSVGGDGTMLHAARLAVEAGLPAFGVNVGHVGYLADIEPDEIGMALDRLAGGDYRISERMTLAASWEGSRPVIGINDVVFEKVRSQHVVHLRVDVAEERFVTYRADGIVVSTPTGSTAYSFSAGGPIVAPELDSIIMTPVAPHSLFARSVVFGPDVDLRLTVERDRSVRINVDGIECAVLDGGSSVRLTRGPEPARLIDFGIHRFPHAVRKGFELDRA